MQQEETIFLFLSDLSFFNSQPSLLLTPRLNQWVGYEPHRCTFLPLLLHVGGNPRKKKN